MPEGVVDMLEAVKIDHQDANAVTRLAAERQETLNLSDEEDAVGKSGDAIFGAAPVGEVLGHDIGESRHSLIVADDRNGDRAPEDGAIFAAEAHVATTLRGPSL